MIYMRAAFFLCCRLVSSGIEGLMIRIIIDDDNLDLPTEC